MSRSILSRYAHPFGGIDLSQMSVSMTMNGAVLPIMALFIVAGEEQGVPRRSYRGQSRTTSSRIHGAQHHIYPPAALDAHHLDIFALHQREHAEVQTRSRSGYHMQEAGATADLSWPIRWPTASSMCAPALLRASTLTRLPHGSRSSGPSACNTYMEIAKMRAARLLWAKLMKPFNPRDQRALSLRTHCQKSGWS